jgi:hypothetical protein
MKIVYNSKDNPCDIHTKFGSIYASGLWEIDLNFKSEQMTTTPLKILGVCKTMLLMVSGAIMVVCMVVEFIAIYAIIAYHH